MQVVVKVGTSTVAHGQAGDPIDLLADQVAALARTGHRIAVTTSGAVQAGRAAYGATLGDAAAAALGQPVVFSRWQAALARHGVVAAQVLVADRDLRPGAAGAAAVRALWDAGFVPVVNGNDPVADARTPVADNDTLAAELALRLAADLLVILTDQDGLCTADPRIEPTARPIRTVTTAELAGMVPGLAVVSTGPHGRGGMSSKARAALRAAQGGVCAVIAHGGHAGVVAAAVAGEHVGTRVEHVVPWPVAVRVPTHLTGEVSVAGGE